MNYNYNDLFSLFNLQQKKIKDVMTEAKQALEGLEYNRHLLERHLQITLRLQEIATSLEVINSRIEEIQGNQRLSVLEAQAGNKLAAITRSNNNNEANASSTKTFAAPENDRLTTSIKQDSKVPSSGSLPESQQTNNTDRSQFIQLEIIELSNQQVKLKTQKNHFEVELNSIEKQLTARGIGTAQG